MKILSCCENPALSAFLFYSNIKRAPHPSVISEVRDKIQDRYKIIQYPLPCFTRIRF